MDIERVRALRGPNRWTRKTAIEALVRIEGGERDVSKLAGFEAAWQRGIVPATLAPPSSGSPGSLGSAASSELSAPLGPSGSSIAHALQHAALRLQQAAGCPVDFGLTVATSEPDTWFVVVQYSEENVGRLALEQAQLFCQAVMASQPFDPAAAIARLAELDEDERLGPSTGAIVDAAVARGIPFRRLTSGSLVQFGWGRKQQRIQAAEMDRTSAVAESIAQDKDLAKSLLQAAGIPVPLGRPVRDADDAWEAALELGPPVVVKPRDGNQGKGVVVNIHTREQVRAAFDVAREYGSKVMVEKFLPGQDFRFLVVGDKLAAAARRDPPLVIGDGRRSIRQLVDEVNADPRRGEGHGTSLTKIRLDETALARLATDGYRPDSIPPAGVRVILRNNANLSTGGSATDVTELVHPELAARVIEAAQTVGLDICGADVVCADVGRPLEEQGGGIVEVNAAPGLRMHLSPSFGQGRPVGQAIIAAMFPEGETGRVPIVAVAGTNGKTTTVRLTAHIAASAGMNPGMTNSDGVYIGGECIDTGDCSGPRSARSVLMHPDVDFAVFETARGGVLREGLAFDRCDVAVITNIGIGDHLGLNHIDTVEELALVKRVIVESVAPHGFAVLNAADPQVVAMAPTCPGSIIYFAVDAAEPVLAVHRRAGGRVVFTEDGALVAAQGDFEQRIALSRVPLTRAGRIGFQVENAMAAMAAAWGAGLDWQAICDGLGSFVNDASTAPGRFNVFEHKGATLIADYGHNPDAIEALVRAVDAMPSKHRFVVISGAGDRRDQDLRRQTEILGNAFDTVILYEDACQRGRAEGEVVGILREGLRNARRTRDVDEIHGEFQAIDAAMERLEPGDLCLILIDQVEEALAHIASRVTRGAIAEAPAG